MIDSRFDILDGSIGYLKFDAFFDVSDCGATASAAMNFVAGSSALIVDMRENGGGSPAMVLKRATIVGETTGGGAHPVGGRRIDEHFIIGVPGARAINPITHTTWEGVGVTPEIKVPAAAALDTVLKLIRK